MTVKITSIISYVANLEKISKRQKEIMLIFKHFNQPMNNKMVLEAMRRYYPRMEVNSITPRVGELKSKGILRYHHTAKCPLTGETTEFNILNSYYRDILA